MLHKKVPFGGSKKRGGCYQENGVRANRRELDAKGALDHVKDDVDEKQAHQGVPESLGMGLNRERLKIQLIGEKEGHLRLVIGVGGRATGLAGRFLPLLLLALRSRSLDPAT